MQAALSSISHGKMLPMNGLFVGISKAGMNALYRMFCATTKRKNMVVFLSRQATQASYDFSELAKQVQGHGWEAVMHLAQVRSKNNTAGSNASGKSGSGMFSYAFHVVRQLKLLATCRMVVLDRYDPVIGLLSFSDEPCIVQIWHAFGAYKKFGHQSIDTLEGHKQETIDTFNIHHNYSWVACSGEDVRAAFSEALNTPIERVIVFNRPEYFELVRLRQELDAQKATGGHSNFNTQSKRVLFAPTLRKSKHSPHPFRKLYEGAPHIEQAINGQITWSFHPLEDGLPAPGNASQLLQDTNLVVTDYSSIAYEAYLLGKPVIFYIPDYESYEESPGINADPVKLCPSLCARTEEELVELVNKTLEDSSQSLAALEAFAGPAFEGAQDASSDLLLTFLPDSV